MTDSVHCINGLPLPLLATQHQMDFMKEMELFSDDIWVVTYPRSGTTWTQQIVRSILDKGDEDQSIDQAVPYLEATNSKVIPYDINFSTIEQPRAIKSHMPYNSMHLKILLANTSMWLATQTILQFHSSTTTSLLKLQKTLTGLHLHHGFFLVSCIMAAI